MLQVNISLKTEDAGLVNDDISQNRELEHSVRESVGMDVFNNLALFLICFMRGTEGTDPARGVEHSIDDTAELECHLSTLWTLA